MRNLAILPLVLAALLLGCSKAPSTDAGGTDFLAAGDPKSTVAQVDGAPITGGELMAEARPSLVAVGNKLAEEAYAQKGRALDRLVEKRLLEARAKKDGITVEALLDREVSRKVQEPAEGLLKAVYEQTRSSGQPLPPFSEVKGEIAAFVKGQSAQELRQQLVARLRSEAKVETFLPPLLLAKVELKADGPSRGEANAPVTIVEFSDYECDFCSRAEGTVREVLNAYKGRVRLVHQPFPLTIHPRAPKAAEAALCAGEQGRYWEMHDSLIAKPGALDISDLKGRARALGLDAARFEACLDSGKTEPAVAASKKLGEGIGVNATPAFFVNGRPLSGAQPFQRFKELVDHELAASKR